MQKPEVTPVDSSNVKIKITPNVTASDLMKRLQVPSNARTTFSQQSEYQTTSKAIPVTTIFPPKVLTANPVEQKLNRLKTTGHLRNVTEELSRNPLICDTSSAAAKLVTHKSPKANSNSNTSAVNGNYQISEESKKFELDSKTTANLQRQSLNVSLNLKGSRMNFLQSLNLTEKQYYDLMNVTNTFFYLRIKGSESSSQSTSSSLNFTKLLGTTNSPSKTSSTIPATRINTADLQSLFNTSSIGVTVQSTKEIGNFTADTGNESVYDLEIITQDQVDKKLYFTLSKEGVTIFRDKTSTFTSLTQWEREYNLYHKVANIKFFKLYRRWKGFTVWANLIRHDKRTAALGNLQSKLFIFNPPLYRSLAKIRGLSLELADKMCMISLEPIGSVFDLDNFVLLQQNVHEKLRVELDNLSSYVLNSVRTACDEVVDVFLRANNIIANHKMTFMERAALRAECKRLTRFLRMVDIAMNDFLLSMVVDAVSVLSNAVYIEHNRAIIPKILTSVSQPQSVVAPVDGEPVNNPIFRLTVNFKKRAGESSDDALSIKPSLDHLLKRVDSVISSCIDVVNSFVKVFSSSETEMYVMPDGDDEEAGGSAGGDGAEPSDLAAAIRSNNSFSVVRDRIFRQLRHSYSAVKDYVHIFEPYQQMYFANQEYISNIPTIFLNGTLVKFQEAIAEYRKMAIEFQAIPKRADVGALLVDSEALMHLLMPSPNLVLEGIKDWLPKLSVLRARELLDEVDEMNPIISSEPGSVESYINKKKTKDQANESLESIRERQNYIKSLVNLVEDNSWTINDDLKALMRMLSDSAQHLEVNIQVADTKEEDETKRFSAQVSDECPKLVKRITECREKLDIALISDPNGDNAKVIKYLQQIESDFNRLKANKDKLQEYQAILKLPIDEFEILDEVQSDLNLKLRLWTDKNEWSILRNSIIHTEISEIDLGKLERDLAKFNKTVFLAMKGLPNNKVVPLFKESVDEINPVIPVILDIRSTALQPNHMLKINDLVGYDIFVNKELRENFTLEDLIQKSVTHYQEEISSIATAALQEAILQEMLKAKVINPWSNLKFEVKSYKDTKDLFILGDTSEIVVTLDDSLVTVNTILGSRYVAGIKDAVDKWRSKLMHFQETLDEWLNCQRNWMYLETIFSSPDISKQLPESAKTFQTIDKSWKLIMKQTNEDPNALKAATHDKSRKDLFKQHNANLDKIQKDLEDYLETKRMAFPRFYFLSNDELLEILSQAKDPRAVQPHLRKCFDNLVKLEFGNIEEGYGNDILAMFSSENERVSLGRNLKVRNAVEEWLMNVQHKMKEVLTQCMKIGLNDYDVKSREDWIFDPKHPGQVIATVAQMTWVKGTEACLRSKDPLRRMVAWSTEYKTELQKIISKIRGHLTKLQRYIAVALVTTDVHARDIIDELVERKVDSMYDFLWQQQLRYYWEASAPLSGATTSSSGGVSAGGTGVPGQSGAAEVLASVDNCFIRHSDARIAYGYEYMGATSRLVITPLTDRCWLTLTGSYALKLGAAPSGPAGTGKTESSKDLAKAMAIQCVVFNCSDQIDYKMMGKLFRGLAQSGAWVCLDEFNRIDIEVLSVIAQQLLVLRGGRMAGKSEINFMGKFIKLIDHHVIITMNPGYAGRTELPDNLQVCFRPVSMMVPNYALIAEIMLFAEGFGDAKLLSQKMCKLYILCSEQLSQQPHYDYGLRAVKSVLVMAGSLKRSNPSTREDLVLIRALRDSNVPKFLADDLPLFAAIVQDLFPGVEIPSNDYGEFQVVLEEELLSLGLQTVPSFMTKVIQMFDIFNIRFGATLVGPAATGKSTVWKVLQAVMTNLRNKKKSLNPEFQAVHVRFLNPKSISMGELYGEFNAMTQEWHDGLASSIMREFVNDSVESEDKKWTVFDGPIDALWIESMNTVLDDNMTLCLANGERIKLKQEMKCLFEVNDLAVASPATVSRIGVVYLSPTDLGHMAYVKSWLYGTLTKDLVKLGNIIPTGVLNLMQDRIMNLVKTIFNKGLTLQRRLCKESIETVDMQLAMSFCRYFQTLLIESMTKANVNCVAKSMVLSQDILMNLVEKNFCFSFIWSVGASISSQYWEAFNDFSRELFDDNCSGLGLPPQGLVFDYFIDYSTTKNEPVLNGYESGKFREWLDIVPSFVFGHNVPYFSLLVPTADTCRSFKIMQTLIKSNKPVFITGVTGTGKTVTVQNLLKLLSADAEESSNGNSNNEDQNQPQSQSATVVEAGIVQCFPIFMNFSAQTRSDVTQMTLESKLEKKRKNLLGAPAGRQAIAFVDDVNMPLVETYGAQPPIELLRQFLDYKGFYDRDKLFWKDIIDVTLFVGAAPPGGGRAVLSQRFTRHFHVLNLPPASDTTLSHIFSLLLTGYLTTMPPGAGISSKFEQDIIKLKQPIVSATIELYTKISEELLPTPSKFHYTFNLRDISKVFQGILMIKAKKCSSADTFIRLWIHEISRVFSDRLINSADLTWFQNTVLDLSSKYMKTSYSHKDIFYKPIIFADYLRPEADVRFYEEIKDTEKLTQVQNDLLDQYNVTFPAQMNLVFFQDALAHTTRICRILRQPRGNGMLVGVGGSGKQSLTRMAAFISGMSCVTIEINRGYRINEFREDIKKLMVRTGVEGKNTVFMFTDSQIIDETMLEDLNNVLNTGEVSNLFPQDEQDKILSDMIAVCKADGIPETRENCQSHFVSRIRDKLHIVLCMSPVGDALRIRCRQFPSLINCTTIDWFHSWPESALVSVAERFLSDLELPSPEIRQSVVSMCGFVHRSIEETSEQFFAELRRRVYTTPKSYLDLINLYMSLLRSYQKVVGLKSDRMKVGVRKLEETNNVVDSLKQELVKLEPILKQKAIETETLLAQVARDSAEAEIVASKVKEEETLVSKQAAETAEIAADAQRDLDKALPALESALKALKGLTKADITEVKSFTNPPRAVQVVLEAVCVLLGEKESWDSAKKLLNQPNFTEMLENYDKENINEKRLKKLRQDYISKDEMQPEVIIKVSKAGSGLCLWVRAMNDYADVAKEVGPKKQRLEEKNNELAVTKSALALKQSQLQEVMDRVNALKQKCNDTLNEKNRLQSETDQTSLRLIRAEKLTSGLSSEGKRWYDTIQILSTELKTLIGDIFLSSACISYYGGFTGSYRDLLISKWISKANELNLPSSSEKYSLAKTLGDPVRIREWHNQGLPTDEVSINSGILVDCCRRWPLMIDPQGQANQWIRRMEEPNGLQITTMRDVNLLRVLEKCIRLGKPLLLEDCSEQMEPALEPILSKAIFRASGGRLLIRLGDSDVDYDEAFKLYMTTKLPNPHYLPEVGIKVTIINFTVTMNGLESQLLGDVVKSERPDIEQRKVQLLLQMAEDKKQLAALEAKILQMLSESEGNILDDQNLIDTLSESKQTSTSISQRVAESELTEKEINDARQRYLPVATRGSLIYFVIADLASIDPMYQYSLSYYTSIFNKCILDSDKSSQLEIRLKNIINYTTYVIYRNICRGLFEKDKLLFSSSICFAIMRNAHNIHNYEWNLFLRGAGAAAGGDDSIGDDEKIKNPNSELIPDQNWELLYRIENKLKYINPDYKKLEKSEEKLEVKTPGGTVVARGRTKKFQSAEELTAEPKSADAASTTAGDEEKLHLFSHPKPFVGISASLAQQLSSTIPVEVSSVATDVNGESSNKQTWRGWLDAISNNTRSGTALLTIPLPEPFESNVTLFQRLLLIKALKEDKLQAAISSFVCMSLGEDFAGATTNSMEDIYNDLAPHIPCIFILSSGADPTGMLLRFASKMGYDNNDKLQLVSLGQGQGQVAKSLIETGKKQGHWVVLQNCMLAKSWMPELDRLIFEIQEAYSQQQLQHQNAAEASGSKAPDANTVPGAIHPNFRLFLTSAPADYFPVSILQNGVKMTNEPPMGLRSNLIRSFSNLIKPEDYNSLGLTANSGTSASAIKLVQWKKLLTSLAFFHANIQERRKFGPLGWNIRYAFDESDLETSIAVLKRFIVEQDKLPWDALNYVTGHINYGGRVTDDWDRRCLMAILSRCLSPLVLNDDYSFSASGIYRPAPTKTGGTYSQVMEYFNDLPLSDGPEVFGMHENVNVAFNKNESLALMSSLLSLQPRSTGGAKKGMSSDDLVLEQADMFEQSLPDLLNEEDAGPTTFVVQSNGLLSSLAICLQQEMAKFNRLITRLKTSLKDLKLAIRGFIVMSADLDAMYTAFLNNKLPGLWETVSFASLKSLSSWFKDLIFRVSFMRVWLKSGQPNAFPLPVFFFPQGFMTASLQTFARRHQTPIDCLSFSFKTLDHINSIEEIKEAPEDGVIIYGLYMEGARYDRATSQVADCRLGKMYDLIPPIHFQPEANHKQPENTYACPVYKTAVRKGVLSTTGMSTNFVVAIELPTAVIDGENKWILGGVAALCNLTD